MPRVTVIIPTYNWSSVLPFSIGSVLRQAFDDFELLVVGDGCTDDSEAVVCRAGDARVRWVNLPKNTGHQSGPNNEGLRQARGELIACLGHDDLWLPHHLARAVEAIDGGADLTYAITEMIAPGNERPTFEPSEMEHYEPGLWIPPTSVVHRRGLSEKVGGWRNFCDVNQDPEADLWERMRAAGGRFAYVRRLTAVKFPAIWRKDVYKHRRCDEQAAWFERITREADFEAVELARMLRPEFADGRSAKPLRETAKAFGEDLGARIKRKLVKWGMMRPMDRAAFFKARRKFKGVEN
jgi:glycosyltransferase involved in cell wall biosynthesis